MNHFTSSTANIDFAPSFEEILCAEKRGIGMVKKCTSLKKFSNILL